MRAVSYSYPTISLFNDIFGDFFDNAVISSTGVKTPVHDVLETDKEYVIEIQLAGVTRENIEINVDENMLTIKAERKKIEDQKFNRNQTYFGKYEKSFNLPENANKEEINASLSDGILKIVIPKVKAEEKLKKITIEID
jgi:HSP20 family protein